MWFYFGSIHDPVNELKKLGVGGSPHSSQSPQNKITPLSSDGSNQGEKRSKKSRRLRARARNFSDVNLHETESSLYDFPAERNPPLEVVFNHLISWFFQQFIFYLIHSFIYS